MFALTAYVTEAHRQVPIVPQDWHFLAAQVHPGGWVYVAIGRIAQYIPGHSAQTWHLLVADDYMLDASGPAYREAIISFFTLCSLVGAPLSWPEETQSVGSALRSSTELTGWASAKGGVNGSAAGPGKWLIPTTYRWRTLRGASAELCTWPARSSMSGLSQPLVSLSHAPPSKHGPTFTGLRYIQPEVSLTPAPAFEALRLRSACLLVRHSAAC